MAKSKSQQAPARDITHPWPNLPFIADVPEGRRTRRDFWHLPDDPVDYGEACDIGRRWAVALLAEQRQLLLPLITEAMVKTNEGRNRDLAGFRVGFMDTLWQFAAYGARMIDPQDWLRRTEAHYEDCKRQQADERRQAALVRVARMNAAKQAKRAQMAQAA